MKNACIFIFNLLFICFCVQINARNTYPPKENLALWYTQPATEWMTSALPIGNGRIGAMIFGGVEQERIQFNDKTLWTGSQTIRGAYQNFGNIYIDIQGEGTTTAYRRELDIENALSRVTYKRQNVEYYREYLASYPDNVIAMRFTANKKGKISLKINLQGARNEKVTVSNNEISLSGKFELLSYSTLLSVKNKGGNTFFLLEELRKTGADKIIIEQIDLGKLYIGESAGSMIVSPNIEYVKEMDDHKVVPNLGTYSALNVIDFYPIPHHTNFPFAKAVEKMISKYSSELDLYPISNSQAILVNGNDVRVESK